MTALDLDTDLLTDLEWVPTLPCGHRKHTIRHIEDDPARWIVRVHCPGCDHRGEYLLCESGRQRFRPPATIGCIFCGFVGYWDDHIEACLPIPEALGRAS